MKIHRLVSLLALVPALALAESKPQPALTGAVQTLVKIDGFPITNLHYSVFAAQQGAPLSQDPKQQARLLNELVNTFMVARSPRGKELATTEEVKAALAVTEARVLARAVIGDMLENTPVTDEEIEAAYKEKYEKERTEYKARHILLKTEKDAKAVIAELDKGADFAKLATEKSTGPSGRNGGDLGWFSPDTMVKPFAEAVAKLENGKYSKEPLKTRFGWHVILREDSRTLPKPKLEEVKAKLSKEIRSRKLTDYIRGLRDKMDIELISNQKKTGAGSAKK